MTKKRVALISGGMGAEHAVSLVTGKAFAEALTELGYPFELIEAGPDLPEQLMKHRPDVALLALHGKYGEDGTVQGICEYLKIPYSGSGVMASALCMNKYFTKQILRFHKIPTPDFDMFFAERESASDVLKRNLRFPLVVKPSREGSTVGISICRSKEELPAALREAQKYDSEIVLEDFIPGMELTIPILGDQALTPIEIVPKQGFYDYKNKYTAGNTEYILPPRLPEATTAICKDWALKSHMACQARVYSRVDLRITEAGLPYVIELNTLPGCTPTSLLPKAAAHDGIPFTKLIEVLVEEARLDYAGVR